MTLLNFQEGEWFKISGRGHVFSTKMPEDHDESLLNKEVMIQGHTYLVTGVEMFTVCDNRLYKGRPVGLLIRGNRKDV
jgi:translation elongation factor EF-Tu-like GTPase